jgi:hypothetical protein
MKHIKIGPGDLIAALIILAATLLRIIFIGLGGPLTNSDEGTIGIMARHIAYRGELPIFYYGQNYMGSTQAYVGAVLFHLFGSSLFSLRLGLVLIFMGFLISTYLLARLLYTKTWALITLVVLGLGSSYVLARELSAIGGYPETLLCGSLSCLLASWLALSYAPDLSPNMRRRRLAAYLCWGIVVGLGLWSDLLVIPFVVMPGLLLLVICWRELLHMVSTLGIALGLCIGAFPLLYYNLHAELGKDSLTILRALHSKSGSFLEQAHIIKELKGTSQISIPLITGNPFCPVTELPFLGPTSPLTAQCTLIRSIWGYGYLFIFVVAIIMTLWALWQAWRERLPEPRHDVVLHCARLMLLGAAAMVLALYTFSDAPIKWPGIHARYIIGLLICTPAIFWPLWSGISTIETGMPRLALLRRAVSSSVLSTLCIVLLIGIALAFAQLPDIQAQNRRDQALINNLLHMGIPHIYTDYWTCNKIAFVSNERVICGVVNGQLKPSHNRAPHYYSIVSSDPRAGYAFPIETSYVTRQGDQFVVPIIEQKIQETGKKYRRHVLDGYVIYQPE